MAISLAGTVASGVLRKGRGWGEFVFMSMKTALD